jgi:chromosome segregation protein
VFLKSLTLKGFKSFADPVTLQLEPGITVVVGPNGSGKSNVVDAVAWVLGAQGPRTVRSQRMEDVIFAGSADRPALGRAEVSLTIDNRAGRLPGGLAEITITRTLFRSGDSEYALNGQPCRLLDIQELLSDSGVGRQQHVIVGQGQLDGILNARPEDRRAVIEEAAGVLKHRRRRERAERRLQATEENLERLGDLLREVRRQMRPLQRQAHAARSHAALAEELRALRLYVVGRELAALDERRQAGAAQAEQLRRREGEALREMAELDAATDAAAARLSARRGEELVVALSRVQGLTERCRGLKAVVAERRRSLGRDLEAAAEVDVVSTLEADAARLSAELEAVAGEALSLEPQRLAFSARQRELAVALAEHEAACADEAALRRAEEACAVAQGQLPALRAAIERDRTSLDHLERRLEALEARRRHLRAESDELRRQLEELDAELSRGGAELEKMTADAESAADARQRAEAGFHQAEAARNRLEARAEALARAAAEAEGSKGVEATAGLPGVLGPLADVLEVDDGYGPALEAALGPAAVAVVADGTASARQALERLRRMEVPGTVLALPGPSRLAGRAGALSSSTAQLPEGTEALTRRVRPAPGAPAGELLTVLLEDLLAGVVVAEGFERAVDAALARPELTVVTAAGDRLSPAGWTVGAGGAAAVAQAAAQASVEASSAAAQAGEARRVLEQATSAAASAAALVAEATRRGERRAERRRALAAALARLGGELEVLEEEHAEAWRDREAVTERYERDAAQLADLEGRLAELESAARAAGQRLAEIGGERRRLEERRLALDASGRELELRSAALAERRDVLSTRLADVERRLAGHAAERERAGERRRRIEADLRAVDRLDSVLETTASRLASLLERLQQERARQVDEVRASTGRLEDLRQRRAEVEAALGELRQRLQAVEVEVAEAGVRHEAAEEALRRELGCHPAEALGAPCPELPEGVDARARAASLEQELAALGPVNPLALEELSGLEERHRFLEEQVDDVRRARRELHQLIRDVDGEIMRLFTEAFTDVDAHFQVLVGALFPGGTGRLTLVEPGDLLNTGVEVEARPAGKNVRKLSLLSGGERSLVALAFLFAVFRSRPSPFYLMDEVEAALDDVNLHRFLDLLHEFRGEAQLIVVSHQKRTMEAADALYGVTMTPGGSSKVVSQKVRRAPAEEPAVGEPAGEEPAVEEPAGATN